MAGGPGGRLVDVRRPELAGVYMRTSVPGTTALARVAMAGLALGLAALAALAVWSTVTNQRATARVGAMNEISDRWDRTFQHTVLEGEALESFLHGGSSEARKPLASAVGGADDDLEWLLERGDPADIEAAARIQQTYATYTAVLSDVVRFGERGDMANAALQADVSALAASSLRKQIAQAVAAKRNQTTEYLKEADQASQELRTLAWIAFAVDLFLLGLCSLVLLDHQRRIRRQATQSMHDALHDGLTGLANRTLLGERAERGVREADRYDRPVGLLLIDLDRFKEVNDTLGHHTGDILLRQIAKRLQTASRDVDVVARLGGDEFAVLLPRIGSIDNATAAAERIHEELCVPVDIDGMRLEVGASIGVAVYPCHADTAEQLLQHADVAMYAAKRSRRGVTEYAPGLNDHSAGRLALVGELRDAIERDELVLHYQPKADARTGEVCGAEALVRWHHPRRGLLGPLEFIPVAEDNKLIRPLTRWVLDRALAQCRAWLSAGEEMPVAVNIGADCLQDETFPATVAELLDQHALPPYLLTLELTESAMITHPKRAAGVMRELGERGVRLSIDDFGTGYSSISLLRQLPVHEMKLDRTFVSRMRTDAGSNAIVRALLDLGRRFGLQMVAEGIEDIETWTELAALECDAIQGFYLGRPMPAAEFDAWLDRHRATALTTAA
jgi:diguanylate cyclase (GGDEF)-like protein